MHAPQLTTLGIYAVVLGMALAKHGEPRENWNFWDSLAGATISVGLLWWGGFFR